MDIHAWPIVYTMLVSISKLISEYGNSDCYTHIPKAPIIMEAIVMAETFCMIIDHDQDLRLFYLWILTTTIDEALCSSTLVFLHGQYHKAEFQKSLVEIHRQFCTLNFLDFAQIFTTTVSPITLMFLHQSHELTYFWLAQCRSCCLQSLIV